MGTDSLLRSTPLLRPQRASRSSRGATPKVEPLPDWITCAEDLTLKSPGRASEPALSPSAEPTKTRSRRNSGSSACQRTSMEIFMRHVRERSDGTVDTSGIMSKECFNEWVASRKNKLKNPQLTFVHTVRSHVTGERKTGRNPFPERVETDLLTLFRQRRVWPCFEGTGVKYGIRGMFVTGYHEGRRMRQEPSEQSHGEGRSTAAAEAQLAMDPRSGSRNSANNSLAAIPLLESVCAPMKHEAGAPLAFPSSSNGLPMERSISWRAMPSTMSDPFRGGMDAGQHPPLGSSTLLPGLQPLFMNRSFDNLFRRESSCSNSNAPGLLARACEPLPVPASSFSDRRALHPPAPGSREASGPLNVASDGDVEFADAQTDGSDATAPLDREQADQRGQMSSEFVEELVDLLAEEDPRPRSVLQTNSLQGGESKRPADDSSIPSELYQQRRAGTTKARRVSV